MDKNKNPISYSVSMLVNTSVDDMRSSLNFEDDIEVIRKALRVVERRGEKTKATMLLRKLKKMEAENASKTIA